MLKKIIQCFSLFSLILLTDCGYKDLQAPCSYTSRGGCGAVVPMVPEGTTVPQQPTTSYPATSCPATSC